jgi:death-on-curing protein
VNYPTLEELLYVAEAVIGDVKVRDHGLLQSAAARPQTSVFGEDAYPTLAEKAAALMHSLARNHALVDGNKRLALAATVVFCGMNGFYPNMTNDVAYDLTMSAATGAADVPELAAVLRSAGFVTKD